MDGMSTSNGEAAGSLSSGSKRGGWISFPFIIGAVAGTSLASSGIISNLIVYLIQEFNITSITATQISNVINGIMNLVPFAAAIIADSLFGSFSVAFLSSCVSFLGTIILALTVSINSLRPHPCNNNGSNQCTPPSGSQYAVLYAGMALAAIGYGGARFTSATLGANQFDKPEHQENFFNWFFFTWYSASVMGITGLVYIENNVSWALGFGICALANLIGVVVFLFGFRFYRPDNLKRSAVLDLVRVVFAAVLKWKSKLSSTKEDYYISDHDGVVPELPDSAPGKRLRFFNRAALITDGDLKSEDGSVEKQWRLCTVQQVEDFKTVIGILPLWTSSIFLAIPIGIQNNFTILQALAMDRSLGPHFKIPAGSILVIALFSTSIFLSLLDRVLLPGWHKLTGKSLTPLQRIGGGHVFNVLAMAVSALVESKRLKIAHKDQMSALWLFPQLVLVGIGESFHYPAQVTFYYQQLPDTLRSTSTAMISLLLGISFYLSTAIIDQVRRSTNWLTDDINYGKLDNLYWMLVVIAGINFVYYLVCSSLYKHGRV